MRNIPRCPRCNGRLFMESEYIGSRLECFWECSVGCNRQFEMDGKPRSHAPRERRTKVVELPVLVR